MILEKLKAGTKNTRDIPFLNNMLRLRILSDAELQQSRCEARAYADKQGFDEENFYIETALRQLYISLSDTDGNKVADNFESFKNVVSRADREYLIEEYLSLEKECSPSLIAMDQSEFDNLIENLKKSPLSELSSSNTDILRRLIRYLESRQRS